MLTLKLSPTSRFFFSFSCSSLFLDGLAKVFHVVSVSYCCRHVWPGLEVLFWPNCQIIVSTSWNFMREQGMRCALEINSDGGFKWGHEESCPSLTKTDLPYHNFYGYQICRVVIYHEAFPLIKPHDPLIMWSCKITWQT